MNGPLVSIIIVNWNGEKFLDICLASLRAQTYKNFEVIVVDNFSTDNSIKFLEKNYLDFVKIIKNTENFGFAKGNNIGIQAANGELIITLNNDTQADIHWLEELLKAVQSDGEIGMCASKIYSFYNRDTIDSVGVSIYWDGMTRGRGRLTKDFGQYDNDREVLLPSACAALYKKKMLEEIGLFDEDFFAYCEDTDLGLRARLAGWKCVLAPLAVIYHFYSSTSGKYSCFKAFMVERNHIWVALKIFPLPLLLMFPFFTFFRLVIQSLSVFTYSTKGKTKNHELFKVRIVLQVLKAYASVLRSLLNILRKRKMIRATKRISDVEIYSWFKRFRLNVKDLTID
jgi:GT2 family glycosyltransferase